MMDILICIALVSSISVTVCVFARIQLYVELLKCQSSASVVEIATNPIRIIEGIFLETPKDAISCVHIAHKRERYTVLLKYSAYVMIATMIIIALAMNFSQHSLKPLTR